MRHYTLELTSINMLTRSGWNSRSVKAGEKVKVIAAPLLSGEPGGLLLEATFSDGRKTRIAGACGEHVQAHA